DSLRGGCLMLWRQSLFCPNVCGSTRACSPGLSAAFVPARASSRFGKIRTGLLALLFGFFVAACTGGLLLGSFAGLLANLLLLLSGFLFGFLLYHGNLLH